MQQIVPEPALSASLSAQNAADGTRGGTICVSTFRLLPNIPFRDGPSEPVQDIVKLKKEFGLLILKIFLIFAYII